MKGEVKRMAVAKDHRVCSGVQGVSEQKSLCYLHCGWTRPLGMDTRSGLRPGPWTHPG